VGLGLVGAAVTRARSSESARNRSSATVRITRPTSRNALQIWFLREFDDNRRSSVTEYTLHCEEPSRSTPHACVAPSRSPAKSKKQPAGSQCYRRRNYGN
jgi:hypothetical protein